MGTTACQKAQKNKSSASIRGLAPAWRARRARRTCSASERRAAFLVLHGFGSNCESSNVLAPTRVLSEFGYVTLRFDMRGCGKSEGEFGRVICLEQVEDLGNALDFLATHPAVDPDRIGVDRFELRRRGRASMPAAPIRASPPSSRTAAGATASANFAASIARRRPGPNSPKCSKRAAPIARAPANR